jgi:hypothetical protein
MHMNTRAAIRRGRRISRVLRTRRTPVEAATYGSFARTITLSTGGVGAFTHELTFKCTLPDWYIDLLASGYTRIDNLFYVLAGIAAGKLLLGTVGLGAPVAMVVGSIVAGAGWLIGTLASFLKRDTTRPVSPTATGSRSALTYILHGPFLPSTGLPNLGADALLTNERRESMIGRPRQPDSGAEANLVDVLVSPAARHGLDFASTPIHGAADGATPIEVFALGRLPGRASRVTVLVGRGVRTRVGLTSGLYAFSFWLLWPLTIIVVAIIGFTGTSAWPASLFVFFAVVLVIVAFVLIASIPNVMRIPEYPSRVSDGWIRIPRVEEWRAERWLAANPPDSIKIAEPIVRSGG